MTINNHAVTALETTTAHIEIEESPLTLEDYRALKGALVQGKRTDHRNVLITRVLFNTGLRVAELLRVTPEHITQEGPQVFLLVRRGKKRGRPQWEHVALHPELGSALLHYIRGNRISVVQPVFGIKPRQLQYIFREASLREVGRPIHPHQLRGLYIKTVFQNLGMPMEAVARLVGHSDVRTTLNEYYRLSRAERYEINRRLPV